MDKFYIITNSLKDPNFETTKQVQEYLRAKGKSCIIQEHDSQAARHSYKYTNAHLVPEDVDCILVVGGDGTLLQACRDLVKCGIPLLGINMGTLGYLAEIDRHSIKPALDKLILNEYVIEKRMMIEGRVMRLDKTLTQDLALNDIVIGREGRLRIIDFNIYVNGEFLNSYSADGIIISTATGSTGYSLSAGGPIVSPEAKLLLVTPIAPHTLNTRSIILPEDARIMVEIKGGHTNSGEGAVATFDGDTYVSLSRGDQVVISKSSRLARLVKINNVSFLEVLRNKMSDQ